MTDEQLALWQKQYEAVIKASGVKVATVREKLRDAQNPGQFCRMISANASALDLRIKLFSLQEWFHERSTDAPPLTASMVENNGEMEEQWAVSEADAQEYLDSGLSLLQQEIENRVDAGDLDPESLAYDAIREFGTHFTGKLIHSSANDAFCYAPDRPSGLPHISSRTLIAAGFPLSLDYKKLDNKGIFPRVLRVFQNDPVAEGLPGKVKEAIQKGAEHALLESGLAGRVDHRLRQILLPHPDGTYVAVSPLAAGGWSEQFWQAIHFMESEESQELEAAEDQESDSDAEQSTQKKRAVRRFQRLAFPVGGAIPRNATRFPPGIIQTACWFAAPEKSIQEDREARRFLHRVPQLRASENQKAELVAQVMSLRENGLDNSVSQLSVKIQSGGALRKWVIGEHERLVALSQRVQELFLVENGEDRAIDSQLLQEKRGQDLDDLDHAILNGAFGSAYREIINKKMVNFLSGTLRNKKDGAQILGQIDRQRIASAIDNILEVC